MKNIFISTITGPDSPGIIKSLAEATRSVGGEWITSKVMKLDGQFAALMKVSIDAESENQLKEELANKFPELTIANAAPAPQSEKPLKIVNLEIDCIDRPGLTKDINDIVSSLDLVVENMEFSRVHVSTIGEAVFNAKLALAVPEETDIEALAEEIESFSDDLRVNIM